MKNILLLSLLVTAVLASSCNKTIKVKRLVGEWTVASYESTSTEEVTETTSFNRAACQPNNFTAVSTSKSQTKRTNNGGSETITTDVTSNGLSFGSTANGNVNISINIKDDGTYEVNGTYSYTYRGNSGTDPATEISGTIATSGNSWYLVDSDKKNAAVTFVNFPYFMGASFSGGTMSFGSGEATFDIEDSEKDKIVFSLTDTRTTTDKVVYPPNNFPETNCVRTIDVKEVNTNKMTITVTK